VDGKLKGTGQWTGPMEVGEYVVEVKKESYRSVSNVINIMSLSERTIDLPSPTPIYGSVELTSRPTNAAVLIDGVERGYTPLIISDVLVGNRTITFKKEGYDDVEKNVEIKEGGEETCSVTLSEVSKELTVSISSNVSKAIVYIDGKYIGVTPLTYSAFIGKEHLMVLVGWYQQTKNVYILLENFRMENIAECGITSVMTERCCPYKKTLKRQFTKFLKNIKRKEFVHINAIPSAIILMDSNNRKAYCYGIYRPMLITRLNTENGNIMMTKGSWCK
jgi:hypothetical protein